MKFKVLLFLLISIPLLNAQVNRKPLKILMVVNKFPYSMQMYIVNQIRGLMDKGHDVTILARRKFDVALCKELKPYDFEGKIFYKYLPEEKRSYDIILCQFGDQARDCLQMQRHEEVKGRLIIAIRGFETRKSVVFPGYYDEAFAYAYRFFPVSNHFKTWLISQGCASEKIRVMGSAIDCSTFAWHERNIPKIGEPINIITVGRPCKEKGIDDCIHACANLVRKGHNIRYTVVGDWKGRKALEELVKQLKITKYITFTGRLEHDQIVELLQKSHIAVLASKQTERKVCEGVPNSLKEAMATGLPVIGTYHGGIPELIEDGVSGYLVPEADVTAIESKLAYLINHPELCKSMGLAGREKVEACFDLPLLTDRLEKYLYEVVDAPEIKIPQKRFVIVVPMYNNKDWYQWNLSSILSQYYENYRVILIDDCSTDGTQKCVEKYLKEHDLLGRVTFVKNKKRVTPLPNRYNAVMSCSDDEIVMFVDGDDFLAHDHVLSLHNLFFQDKDVWLTYAEYQRWCSSCRLLPYPDIIKSSVVCNHIKGRSWEHPISQELIKRNMLRFKKFHVKGDAIHLISFYAWLYKYIDVQSLMYNGKFMPRSSDIMVSYPLFELAGEHVKFVPETCLLYNRENPLNEGKVKDLNPEIYGPSMLKGHKVLRSRKPYKPLFVRE